VVEWHGSERRVIADPGRLAQALGNLVANAAEHGHGPVHVRGTRAGRVVRVEVENDAAPRGRGLAVARAAARGSDGDLRVERVRATLELPAADR
jgi:hypothetical protein